MWETDASAELPSQASHVGVGPHRALTTSEAEPKGRQVFLDYCSFCHELSGESGDSEASGLIRTATGEAFSREELQVILQYPPPGMLKLPLDEEQVSELLTYLQTMPRQTLITPNGRP
jgi:mono/diheme cytochrome c family protein